MANSNLKGGIFSRNELALYECLREKDIDIILEYQKKLPILQENDEKWINTRDLYIQLGVGRDYNTWIKQQFEDLDYEEDVDYNFKWMKEGYPFKELAQYSSQKMRGLGYSKDYFTTVEIAKEIAMISGAKGGRTSKELIHNSHLARKYFIFTEKAFKERTQWNSERANTIEMCKELKRPLYKMKDELEEYIPFWFKGNVYSFEFNLLNTLIIGKSATKYRIEKGLKANYPIRNTFDKHTLDIVHKLEQYDAILLEIQNMLNWEDRKPLLSAYFCSIKND